MNNEYPEDLYSKPSNGDYPPDFGQPGDQKEEDAMHDDESYIKPNEDGD